MTDVNEAFAPANERVIAANPAVQILVAGYHADKRAEAQAKAKAEKSRALVVAALDGANADKFVVGDDVIVSRVHVRRPGIDKTILARLAPKALAKATKFTEFDRIDIPFKK